MIIEHVFEGAYGGIKFGHFEPHFMLNKNNLLIFYMFCLCRRCKAGFRRFYILQCPRGESLVLRGLEYYYSMFCSYPHSKYLWGLCGVCVYGEIK